MYVFVKAVTSQFLKNQGSHFWIGKWLKDHMTRGSVICNLFENILSSDKKWQASNICMIAINYEMIFHQNKKAISESVLSSRVLE